MCLLLVFLLALGLCACGEKSVPAPAAAAEEEVESFQSLRHAEITIRDYGTVKLELDEGSAPITVANFCKLAQQEDLMSLMPHMCVMDYPTIEYKGGALIRTKTLGAGDDCCDFHVVKK